MLIREQVLLSTVGRFLRLNSLRGMVVGRARVVGGRAMEADTKVLRGPRRPRDPDRDGDLVIVVAVGDVVIVLDLLLNR